MPSKCSIIYTYLLAFIHLVRAPLRKLKSHVNMIKKDFIFGFFSASIFPVCFRDDPQLSNCIVQAVNVLRPRLTTGDLGDGFRTVRLDPLYIPK